MNFINRFNVLLINKANLYITLFVLGLLLVGVYFGYVLQGRAILLVSAYAIFMVVYQAINAFFLPDAKYLLVEQKGLGALGNPIEHNERIGRIFHYLLMGGIFALAIGAPDGDPTAAYRGLSSSGLLFAGVYGIFTEMKVRNQKKKEAED